MAGKAALTALVAAVFLVQAGLAAAEESAAAESYPDALVSLRRNATVSIGGEIRTDAARRAITGRGHDIDIVMRNTNLRLQINASPNLMAMIKLDLTKDVNDFNPDIVEEAYVVMQSLCGSGVNLIAGKTRAPYGQDVTLGIVQSYHHTANLADTSEGLVYIIDPPPAGDSRRERRRPPMRPGQLDRVVMAGASYERDERWKLEAAFFQPDSFANRWNDRPRTYRDEACEKNDIGAAARLWWRPFEDFVMEASTVAMHSSAADWRGEGGVDAGFGRAQPRKTAYAASAGFDWRRGPWRWFGEYQHGWNWNFTKGYDTDAVQVGAAREIGGAWRAGAMAEHLRIADDQEWRRVDKYYKLVFNLRYTITQNVFVLFEYGCEWFRRTEGGGLTRKQKGDLLGVRFGFSF